MRMDGGEWVWGIYYWAGVPSSGAREGWADGMGWTGLMDGLRLCEVGGRVCVFSARGRAQEVVCCVML